VDVTGKVMLPPAQTAEIGLKVGAMGLVTLMVVVAVHPLLLVKVMVLVPKPRALTRPVFEMVATPALLDVQALEAAGFALAVNCELVFGQRTVFPVKIGVGATVTVT
jgi:hypothetical protein